MGLGNQRWAQVGVKTASMIDADLGSKFFGNCALVERGLYFVRSGGPFSEPKLIEHWHKIDTGTQVAREPHFCGFGLDRGAVLGSQSGANGAQKSMLTWSRNFIHFGRPPGARVFGPRRVPGGARGAPTRQQPREPGRWRGVRGGVLLLFLVISGY